jgi:hypothetical protein
MPADGRRSLADLAAPSAIEALAISGRTPERSS